MLEHNLKSRKNTPARIVQVSYSIFEYTNVRDSELVAKLNIGDRISISEFSYYYNFLLAGHKCKFAADQKTPCPKDQFTSYLNQTTCQDCDIGLGEKCYEHAKEAGSFITGQDHISDAIGSSLSYVKKNMCQKYKLGCVVRMVVDSILPHEESGPNYHRKDALPFTLMNKKSQTRFKVAKCYEKELFKTTSKFT